MSEFNWSQYKQVYMCSPLKAETREGVIKNMENAKNYSEMIEKIFGCKVIAPHAYLPNILDDNNPDERLIAMELCLKCLEFCDAVIIISDIITEGMQIEIDRAKELGLPSIQFSAVDFTAKSFKAIQLDDKTVVVDIIDGKVIEVYGIPNSSFHIYIRDMYSNKEYGLNEQDGSKWTDISDALVSGFLKPIPYNRIVSGRNVY